MDATLEAEKDSLAEVSAKLTAVLRAEALNNFGWDVALEVLKTERSVSVRFPGPLENGRARDAAMLEDFVLSNEAYALQKYGRDFG